MPPAFCSLCAFHLDQLLTLSLPPSFFKAQTQALSSSMKPSLVPQQEVVPFLCTAIIYGCGLDLLLAGPPCTAFKIEYRITPEGATETHREWYSLESCSTGPSFIKKSKGQCMAGLAHFGTPQAPSTLPLYGYVWLVSGNPSSPDTSAREWETKSGEVSHSSPSACWSQPGQPSSGVAGTREVCSHFLSSSH